jgi:NAD(P)-dependent dehydrogenase (short-subunit alcohol dehydrogenase family)
MLALDVTSDESVAAAAKTVSTLTGGRVDLVVNNVSRVSTERSAETRPA